MVLRLYSERDLQDLMTVFQSFVLVSLLVPYDRPLFIRIFYGLGNEKAKYREYLFYTLI